MMERTVLYHNNDYDIFEYIENNEKQFGFILHEFEYENDGYEDSGDAESYALEALYDIREGQDHEYGNVRRRMTNPVRLVEEFTFKKGDMVTIVCTGYGLVSYERGKVLSVRKGKVLLDNGSGNDPSGPFDSKTGADLRGACLGLSISIIPYDKNKNYGDNND